MAEVKDIWGAGGPIRTRGYATNSPPKTPSRSLEQGSKLQLFAVMPCDESKEYACRALDTNLAVANHHHPGIASRDRPAMFDKADAGRHPQRPHSSQR